MILKQEKYLKKDCLLQELESQKMLQMQHLYLASDEANWVTGTVLNVDGGKTASEG